MVERDHSVLEGRRVTVQVGQENWPAPVAIASSLIAPSLHRLRSFSPLLFPPTSLLSKNASCPRDAPSPQPLRPVLASLYDRAAVLDLIL
ncbi:uncharacterized protein STEHIDRAFT_168066 [Stereum hirsutum FP-91666 SS1]|uniref:uncharacterized protein n=1 Tax=Stereum hirsutum (strain FP-91666) TaxID=721885 RepID=UPI000440B9ED|nr:uncharacterized protein STEHIDRAFT_168066 [Stereum hirsutum FP-91666 SS1]EIM87256.1 hypothetical protein STEHIDRAFT_168066 [Stereum hirsutum FP-91666 SS1]